MAMEVEIISTEAIKPSSPTPDHLRTFKLSLFDQLTPPVFSKLVYFYLPSSAAPGSDQEAEVVARSKLLKSSLSEILPRFYPFAGRIKGNFSIDCNDDGAIFVEARVRCRLAEVLKEPVDEVVKQFLPLNTQFTDGDGDGDGDSGRPLLLVQSSFFECGGVVIGFLFYHKIADAAAMATFITAWAAAASGSGDKVPPPELLMGTSLFPPKDFLANIQLPIASPEKISTKRFVFAASSIGALKSKAAGESTHQQPAPPTRVEAVAALIWKCATMASRSHAPTKSKKPSILFQSVNLRKRFNPPLPENSMGNIVGYYPVEASEEDTEMELRKSVEGLKRGLIELSEGFVKELQGKEGGGCDAIMGRMKLFQRGEADTYTVTSWCRFPVHEADFGWGKPVWVCTVYLPFKNVVVLMDSSDGGGGGIEAWVCLKEEDMAVFERDQELLAYASLNPPAGTEGLAQQK